jgi:catechol 2,3-dioxygenase-like lactoylglutathione lyase family enzyme
MSIASPAKFAHVVYRTRCFEQMLAWYQTVFNARVQHQNPALAFLTYDDEHHRVALANMDVLMPATAGIPNTGKQGLIGVDHVAYSHPSLERLFENYAQLKAQGITPYWCVHHGVTVSMYYADPDGNQMEFQVDAYPTNDEANAFMCGPGFAENPIGVEFDPEEWLGKVRAGGRLSDFLLRREHQPASPVRGSACAAAEPSPVLATH